jgi:hypothetical protein
VYVVTDYSTANIFGYDQIRFLSKDGFKVHLVCGTGKLRSDLSNQVISTTQLSKLTRNISLLNDIYDDLNEYWPSCKRKEKSNLSFWSHEWKKHGTCM